MAARDGTGRAVEEAACSPLEHNPPLRGHDIAMSTTDNVPLPSFLMDMDGVLVHEEEAIPGADRFIKALEAAELPLLGRPTSSTHSPCTSPARPARAGI